MKRRTLLAGLGAVASGSGAIATSAAVANSVQTASQLSIVVDERLEVRAGKAFNDDGSVKKSEDNYDNYVPYDGNNSFFTDQSGGLDDINKSDAPVATVNRRDGNINDGIRIQTAISVENGKETPVFEDILEVENYGGKTSEVGIAYDPDDSQYDPNGQYGSDVVVNGDPQTELTDTDVQSVYRFFGPDGLISPDWSTESDEPEWGNQDYMTLAPGETKQIELRINLTPYLDIIGSGIDPTEHISEAADTTPTFQGTLDTVAMLDAITVMKRPESE